jgi:hypothetical protein
LPLTSPVSWTAKAVSASPSSRACDTGSGGKSGRVSRSVSQNADHAQLLHAIKGLWECGFIRPDRSDKTLKYEVRTVQDLVEKVIPHFRAFPLLSSKQQDVERFAAICEAVHTGEHLTREGLRKIVGLAMGINPSGKRKYSATEILGSVESGEGIVYALGNQGST